MAARSGVAAAPVEDGGGGFSVRSSGSGSSSAGGPSSADSSSGARMELCEAGRVAVRAFGYGLSVVAVGGVQLFGDSSTEFLFEWWPFIGIVFTFAVHCLLFVKYCLVQGGRIGYSDYPIIVRAAFLGSVCGFSLLSCCLGPKDFLSFSVYGVVLSMFHFSEYLVTALINPRFLSTESFLLDQSREYHTAIVVSWIEYAFEAYFYPQLKALRIIYISGLALCICGEMLRKGAMLTAGSNFHHLIRTKREENHRLVTTGVYSMCRHPSYAGWFLWSVGTQLLLVNPICLIGYTMVTWMFFRERVEDEEITLLEFFGEDYANYQKQVATGLPFIKGFKMEL